MKNSKMILGIAIILVIGFTVIACNKSSGGGGKSINSAEELKTYLDKQPANSPDKPIKVSMTINNPMIESVGKVISEAGKYVSLNITGNALTTISFGNDNLVGITLPNSVTKIEYIRLGNPNSINIPAGVTEIGSMSVSAINVNAANANFSSQDGVLFNKDKTTLLQYPYKKTGETYTIPNGVTTIESLRGENLTSITIPNSVTSIGDHAFYECYYLTSVTFEGKIPPEKDGKGLAPNAFGGDVTYYTQSGKSWVGVERGSGYIGDLYEKYIAGGPGTYTRPDDNSETWTKQ